MPLVLDSASVVVKGNFNPYIFSPEWLANQDVWAQQEVHLALGMLSDGIRFRNALGDTTWEVDSKTLVVQSISNAGFLVAKVLRKLSHTPVNACGCNFSFSSAERTSLVPQLGNMQLKDLPQELSPEIVKWSGVFHVEQMRIDMSVASGDQGVTVTFNFHQSVDTAEAAALAAESFSSCKQRACDMIKSILGEEVTE